MLEFDFRVVYWISSDAEKSNHEYWKSPSAKTTYRRRLNRVWSRRILNSNYAGINCIMVQD